MADIIEASKARIGDKLQVMSEFVGSSRFKQRDAKTARGEDTAEAGSME
jgi:hypothetical protein